MPKNKILFALLLSLFSLSVQAGDIGSTGSSDAAKGTDTIYLCGAPPTGGVWAQFAVGSETFNAYITNPAAIDDAIRLWYKPATATKRIPIGRLNCEPALWNCSWGWHQSPSSVTLTDAAVEVCDGTPSYVECRKDPGCPAFRR
jgi:hypothetical protein